MLEAPRNWPELAAGQAGVLARRQLIALGMTPAQARQFVETGRWQRLRPGVYATFSGPVPQEARVWAAVLYAGQGACASHGTALWLAKALDRPPSCVQVSVPIERRVRAAAGMAVFLTSHLETRIQPASSPPRTRLEEAVLDVTDRELDVEAVLTLVFRVTQRRLTTADRLRAALSRRSRHRWRVLLLQVLAGVQGGSDSALEHRYARDVERAHRLPAGSRNRPEPRADGRAGRWYRDVRYAGWRTVVELDGRAAHPKELAFRDLRRDNAAMVQGDAVLRYGWHDVAARPCAVAQQVSQVLRARGWPGAAQPCGPACPLGAPS